MLGCLIRAQPPAHTTSFKSSSSKKGKKCFWIVPLCCTNQGNGVRATRPSKNHLRYVIMSPTKEGLFHLGLEPQAIWPTHTYHTTSNSHTHKYTLSVFCQIAMQRLWPKSKDEKKRPVHSRDPRRQHLLIPGLWSKALGHFGVCEQINVQCWLMLHSHSLHRWESLSCAGNRSTTWAKTRLSY